MRVLFIGRFQPLHLGHMSVLERLMDDEVIIGIGSAHESHTIENPFTCAERAEMLLRSGVRPLSIVPLHDIHRYALWVRHVESICPFFEGVVTNNVRDKVLFQEAGYRLVEMPLFRRNEYSGTEVRRRIASGGKWRSLVPEGSASVIDEVEGEERIRLLSMQVDRPG